MGQQARAPGTGPPLRSALEKRDKELVYTHGESIQQILVGQVFSTAKKLPLLVRCFA